MNRERDMKNPGSVLEMGPRLSRMNITELHDADPFGEFHAR